MTGSGSCAKAHPACCMKTAICRQDSTAALYTVGFAGCSARSVNMILLHTRHAIRSAQKLSESLLSAEPIMLCCHEQTWHAMLSDAARLHIAV